MQKFIIFACMNKQEFWKIIDASLKVSTQHKIRSQAITDLLSQYLPEQIIKFEVILRELITEADEYGVMAILKIMEGWVTDDSWIYFRCWLIGQGEQTFYETLKEPDSIANKVDKNTNFEFEELLYVATDAYKVKTNKTVEDDTFPRYIASEMGLEYDVLAPPTKGEEWESEDVPKICPNLWAKFNAD
ncbi:MAG: DUF4240 domain-containing protein [Bacteroidetes bacterium]|nr:MAG: DUF4240 domain-containing protein [Bacteroidota bacterium]